MEWLGLGFVDAMSVGLHLLDEPLHLLQQILPLALPFFEMPPHLSETAYVFPTVSAHFPSTPLRLSRRGFGGDCTIRRKGWQPGV